MSASCSLVGGGQVEAKPNYSSTESQGKSKIKDPTDYMEYMVGINNSFQQDHGSALHLQTNMASIHIYILEFRKLVN